MIIIPSVKRSKKTATHEAGFLPVLQIRTSDGLLTYQSTVTSYKNPDAAFTVAVNFAQTIEAELVHKIAAAGFKQQKN